MAFVSCNTTDNEYDVTEPIAVNLRANINPATTRVMNDQWQTNDQVGLFMVRTGLPLSAASVFGDADNMLMTIQSGVLTSNPPVMYPLTGNVDFIAYYPFHSSVGNNFTIPVNVADQEAGLPTEVLFSNNITNQAPTSNPVTLNFYYSLAKLEVRVIAGANSTHSAVDFENMTVSIAEMYTQADLQLANGAFTNHSGRQTITLYNTGSNATSASFAALVLPANEGVTFLFDVNGTMYRHTMTVNYVAANLYRLNFALDFPAEQTRTATLLNAVIIPREENIQDISVDATHHSVEINGVQWATRNVGAPGTFVNRPEDAGMFYQWNRRIGWSSADPLVASNGTTWNNSFPESSVWTKENDPCPYGWRIPTYAEFRSLNEVVNVWTIKNGVNGRLFGTAPHQIFLPAAGWRSTNGTFSFSSGEEVSTIPMDGQEITEVQLQSGIFWSRTQIEHESGTMNARGLFVSENSNTWIGWITNIPPNELFSNAASVRCVVATSDDIVVNIVIPNWEWVPVNPGLD